MGRVMVAPTPTAAAELAAPARVERLAQVEALAARLQRAGRSRMDRWAQGLDLLAHRVARPASRLAAERERLEAWRIRLPRAVTNRLVREREGTTIRVRAVLRITQQRLAREHYDEFRRFLVEVDAALNQAIVLQAPPSPTAPPPPPGGAS